MNLADQLKSSPISQNVVQLGEVHSVLDGGCVLVGPRFRNLAVTSSTCPYYFSSQCMSLHIQTLFTLENLQKHMSINIRPYSVENYIYIDEYSWEYKAWSMLRSEIWPCLEERKYIRDLNVTSNKSFKAIKCPIASN